MKTFKNSLVLICITLSAVLNAQGNFKNSKVEEIHQKKWQYLVEQAELSPSEIELVKPVFGEYENAIWSRHEKNREFFKSARSNNQNVNLNYAEMNDRYAEIEYIQGQLFKSYHLKLRKLLTAETLFKYYKAEREFKRKLLQNLPDQSHRNHNNHNSN